jgi:ergothioneine biosynthesis protein EgtB
MSDDIGELGAKKLVNPGIVAARFEAVRGKTAELAAPLAIEDYVVQSAPEVSPTKWHLAHTTWFFETFVLTPFVVGYKPFHPKYAHLFNSYYQTVGQMHAREKRGLLSRPTVEDVYTYRRVINERVCDLIAECGDAEWAEIATRIELGLHHEQQHQELLLMDIKHVFATNPMRPSYRPTSPLETLTAPPLRFLSFEGGIANTGYRGGAFCYDNELPRHSSLLQPFQLANRCVTNKEYAGFIADGGYSRSELWLSDGWATVVEQGWEEPLYWEKEGKGWAEFRLAGLQDIDPHAPVVHVSYYEADAYARWAGFRLPSEAEWEVVAQQRCIQGNFVESGLLHPRPATDGEFVEQIFGDVWEITNSAYKGYPGFKPLAGSLGEYNGKFMSGQMVLRGGSCITPQSHMRASYRNFYPPHQRWSFQGFRLASNTDD